MTDDRVPECRPDVPVRPPAGGYNSNIWYYGGPPEFSWMGKRPDAPAEGSRICESYLLAYIQELRRQHAEEWLRKDDDIRALQELNTKLARQALDPAPKATPWATRPHGSVNA